MAKTKEQPWIKTDAQLEEELLHFWQTYFLEESSQMFQTPFGAGYWLYGVDFSPNIGWLAYEFDEATFKPSNEKQHAAAIKAWKEAGDLPEHYFRLDFAMAKKMFNAGVRKWGQDWYEEMDLPRLDLVLQWSLLGEQRYG